MNKKCFGYIRVSTQRQGDTGVSLQEQRSAIERYAQQHQIEIAEWFEERETAAKRGRPVFSRMLRLLTRGRVRGVIIHKIDRSARNLRDWADLGELLDQGIEVHFANESLDLHTRGGRLSADIQAVVAADYIRNLREETKKGMNGRLKQGLYPWAAPLGYLNTGKGRPKEIDPVKGPLVQKVFELYASGNYGLYGLLAEMTAMGLRNFRGRPLTINGLSTMLNNPFYIGLMKIRGSEIYQGVHEPLISKRLFDQTQAVLRGKTNMRAGIHAHVFRKMLVCGKCRYHLIGERQRRHIYYRCHSKNCPKTIVREDRVDAVIEDVLNHIRLSDEELYEVREWLSRYRLQWEAQRTSQVRTRDLRLEQIKGRLDRLIDAYIEGSLEKNLFESRKAGLLLEQRECEEQREALRSENQKTPDRADEFLELVRNAARLYRMASNDEKRDLLKVVTSNIVVHGRSVDLVLLPPFEKLAKRASFTGGAAGVN